MPRVEVTMSTANQVTVPSELRKRWDLKPGDKIVFDMDKGVVTVDRAETHEEKIKRAFAKLDAWREALPDEAKEKIKKYAGWTVNQYHEQIDKLPETKAYMQEKYSV